MLGLGFGLGLKMGRAYSKKYYVASSGNDSNDGSSESPFLTIAKANTMAVEGNTIVLNAGDVFNEQLLPVTGVTYKTNDMSNPPIVTTREDFRTGWTNTSGNLWEHSYVNDVGYLVEIEKEGDIIQANSATVFDSSVNGWGVSVSAGTGVASRSHDTSVYNSSPGSMRLDCTTQGTSPNHIRLLTSTSYNSTIKVKKNTPYTLKFYAKASAEFSVPEIKFYDGDSSQNLYSVARNLTPVIGTDWVQYEVPFMVDKDSDNVRLEFYLGGSGGIADGESLWIDDIFLYQPDLIYPEKQEILPDVDAQGKFYCDGVDTITVYSASDPATFYTNLYAGVRLIPLDCRTKSNFKINGIEFKHSGSHVAYTQNCSNVDIRNSKFKYGGGSYLNTNIRYGNGFECWQGNSNITFTANEVKHTYDSGVTTQGEDVNYTQENINIYNNVVENCYQSFEIWGRDVNSTLNNIKFNSNVCKFAGFSFSNIVRPDTDKGYQTFNYVSTAVVTNCEIKYNTFKYSTDGNYGWIRSFNDFEELDVDYNMIITDYLAFVALGIGGDTTGDKYYTEDWEEYKTDYTPKDANSILFFGPQASIFSYSVGDWGLDDTVRVLRIDDDFEKEFEPVAGTLDVAGITDFNSWNMLDGGEYRDYLYDVPLGVDSNLDGVSDGWGYSPNGFDGTVVNSVSDKVQKITITESGTNTNEPFFIYTKTGNVIGEEYFFSLDVRVSGGVSAIIRLSESGSGDVNSSIITSTEWENVIVSTTLSSTNNLELKLRARPVPAGTTGYVEYRNAKLVKNSFIEDIGLLTEDDNLDGVANEWNYSSNGFDGTIARSVDSTNGQKLDIIASGTPSEPYISIVIPTTDGNIFTVSVEARVSSGIRARLVITELPNGDGTTGDYFTNTDWETIILTSEATDGGDTTIDVKLRIEDAGSTGYVEYRNATLKQTNNSTYVSKVFDKSGNGNHAVQTVAEFQPRLINAGVFEVMSDGDYGMFFDGVDDRFDVVDSSGLDITTGDLSLLANFDPDILNTFIFTRNYDSSSSIQYALAIVSGGTLAFLNGTVQNEDNNTDLSQKISIATYDHLNSKIYLDSSLENSNAFSSDLITPVVPFVQIGCRSTSTDGLTKSTFFEGHINRVTVFAKALTQAEITYLTSKV